MFSENRTQKPRRLSPRLGSFAQEAERNKLLASLSGATLKNCVPEMELIAFRQKQVLHVRDAPLSHVYFPLSGLISLVMPSNGKFVEVGMVGDEGMFGVPLFLGTTNCPMTAISQVGGAAMRWPADRFLERLKRDGKLLSRVKSYTHAFTIMLAQGAVCNSAHSIEQRCARWLLTAHDRLHTDHFELTQAFLAQVLGVRRPSVSEVAGKLQRRKLIHYRQGRMTVVDPRGLQALSCVCYSVIHDEFARVGLA